MGALFDLLLQTDYVGWWVVGIIRLNDVLLLIKLTTTTDNIRIVATILIINHYFHLFLSILRFLYPVNVGFIIYVNVHVNWSRYQIVFYGVLLWDDDFVCIPQKMLLSIDA